jgi:hypothetical protein
MELEVPPPTPSKAALYGNRIIHRRQPRQMDSQGRSLGGSKGSKEDNIQGTGATTSSSVALLQAARDPIATSEAHEWLTGVASKLWTTLLVVLQ